MSPTIVGGLKLGPTPIDTEDLAVGSSGLISRRDRATLAEPQNTAKWTPVTIRRNSTVSPTAPTANNHPATIPVAVWLPKDRDMVARVLDVYFTRLNIHRPVLIRTSFERSLDELYSGTAETIDPGLVCSVYLVLALGTLSVALNAQREICVMQKMGGAPLGADEILGLVDVAVEKAKELDRLVEKRLKQDWAQRHVEVR